ncbi:hypothetical protein [Echinicola salinicaeni]|uniref:hypothetical protein n=1 Tax=Echinicola salinicaeni TaxID=2762757 RepID=UPI001647DA9B|nr:hypothetical protein [Echinicola salinicaeni]
MKLKELAIKKKLKDPEASLIWDEYKYRHDLIWKHMIRSTIAVIGSITLPFTKSYLLENSAKSYPLLIMLSVALLIYVLYTVLIVNKEINILNTIKEIHRSDQHIKFGAHSEYVHKKEQGSDKVMIRDTGSNHSSVFIEMFEKFNFRKRVNVFLILLLIVALFSLILLFQRSITIDLVDLDGNVKNGVIF